MGNLQAQGTRNCQVDGGKTATRPASAGFKRASPQHKRYSVKKRGGGASEAEAEARQSRQTSVICSQNGALVAVNAQILLSL